MPMLPSVQRSITSCLLRMESYISQTLVVMGKSQHKRKQHETPGWHFISHICSFFSHNSGTTHLQDSNECAALFSGTAFQVHWKQWFSWLNGWESCRTGCQLAKCLILELHTQLFSLQNSKAIHQLLSFLPYLLFYYLVLLKYCMY